MNQDPEKFRGHGISIAGLVCGIVFIFAQLIIIF